MMELRRVRHLSKRDRFWLTPRIVCLITASVFFALFVVVRWKSKRQDGDAPAAVGVETGGQMLAGRRLPRVALLIMTSPVDPSRRVERVKSIVDTWGNPVTLQNELNIHIVFEACEVELKHYPVVCPPGHIVGRTAKTLFLMRELFQRGILFEYVVKADDLAYFFPRNLQTYLSVVSSGVNPLGSLFLAGNVLRNSPTGITFVSAGAGVIMSRSLVDKCLADPPRAFPDNEDLAIAFCAGTGVPATQAMTTDGFELFNVYGPVKSMQGRVDPWYENYKRYAAMKGAISNGVRTQGISPLSIVSFHYVEYALQRFWHSLVTEYTDKWDATKVLDEFPKSGLGGYENKISSLEEAQELLDMAGAIRKELLAPPR